MDVNTRAMVARLNQLDEQLCMSFGLVRATDALTLDEAIAMTAATTESLIGSLRGHSGSAGDQGSVVDFLRAQVEARQMRADDRIDVPRSLTASIRRMKKSGSLQGLGRQACTELSKSFGFDFALISFVEEHGFVVAESDNNGRPPTIISTSDCPVELACIRRRSAALTNEPDIRPSPLYQELLGSPNYLVGPVIAGTRVVALLHVARCTEEGFTAGDVDVLDAFASAYSLLHERILNAERVKQQRTSITYAATRLTERAERIAASAINFDADYDARIEPRAAASDSALASALSQREREVFERLILGASNAEIGDELVITIETVKTHVKRILRKIGAINRSEAIALYMEEMRITSSRPGALPLDGASF